MLHRMTLELDTAGASSEQHDKYPMQVQICKHYQTTAGAQRLHGVTSRRDALGGNRSKAWLDFRRIRKDFQKFAERWGLVIVGAIRGEEHNCQKAGCILPEAADLAQLSHTERRMTQPQLLPPFDADRDPHGHPMHLLIAC